MKVPVWHAWQWGIWIFTGLPFQWLMTRFNGLPFFSLPDAPGPGGPSPVEWILVVLFLYHPFLTAPFAFALTVKRFRERNSEE
jgi:hypothetical protein